MKWLFSLMLALALTAGCSEQKQTTQSAAPVPASPYEKLVGKWMRPDGGYILEFKYIAADGKMEAGYFNPSPINVSKAEASMDGETLKVFVELRDQNYPGCTYKLTYDATNNHLRGEYYQAAMQETYEIVFVRVPQDDLQNEGAPE